MTSLITVRDSSEGSCTSASSSSSLLAPPAEAALPAALAAGAWVAAGQPSAPVPGSGGVRSASPVDGGTETITLPVQPSTILPATRPSA